jgi:hypothetical protein
MVRSEGNYIGIYARNRDEAKRRGGPTEKDNIAIWRDPCALEKAKYHGTESQILLIPMFPEYG